MFWMRRPKTAVISFDNEWAYFLVSRNWKTTLNVEPEYETKLSQHQYIFKLFQVMEWIRRVSFWMTWSSPISIRILEIFFSLFLSYRSLKKNHRTRSSVKIPTMIINDVIMHFKIAISPHKNLHLFLPCSCLECAMFFYQLNTTHGPTSFCFETFKCIPRCRMPQFISI